MNFAHAHRNHTTGRNRLCILILVPNTPLAIIAIAAAGFCLYRGITGFYPAPIADQNPHFATAPWHAVFSVYAKQPAMPWYNGDYPPSYKNQPPDIRNKATEIANELLLHGTPEGIAIATGLKQARQASKKKTSRKK